MSLIDSLLNREEGKTIRIECEGKAFVNIHDLQPLQGKLKTLHENDYQKLKTSILELGFSDPFSVWKDPSSGTLFVHDGHERLLTLLKMEEEDYTIPLLPASYILADDKRQAKKKLLANDSSYGKITQEGLYEFMNEEGFELSDTELSTFIEIPQFDFEFNQPVNETPEEKPKEKKETCASCEAYHTNEHQTTSNT